MKPSPVITSPWSLSWIKQHPIKTLGIIVHLLLRTLFALFWLAGGINKIVKEWLTTNVLSEIFLQRLTELPPDSFAAFYLQHFAVPLSLPLAWAVTIGEIYSGLALLLGVTTRWASAVALFIMVNFALGGYYDASLIPFFLLTILFICYPSGHWLGMDRKLYQRFPNIWFR